MVGVLETAALLVYAASIVGFEFVGETSGIVASDASLAVPVLVAVLVVFGVLDRGHHAGLWRGRAIARTPFVVVQAFAVVAAWPVATGGPTWERVLGLVLVVAAVVAGLAAMSPSASEALDR